MGAKQLICQISDLGGVFALGQLARRRHRGYVRAVNYHGTPREHADNFRNQLEFYQHHFVDTSRSRLEETLSGKAGKPAILLSFDDGYRSNYEIAAPLLEEFGFTGWFFISSGRYRDDQAERQLADGQSSENFMNFAEMKDLIARGHVVGCHTHTHVRLSEKLNDEELIDEIVTSRSRLQQALSDPIDTFCWVGGEDWSYSTNAAKKIQEAGYDLAFMTNSQAVSSNTDPLWIQRTNIEADWPLAQVRFYLSGIMDVVYHSKRQRISKNLEKWRTT
ncbi:MAG: polysaccharide deacetylase family protein [Rhizobiaceae bacterium]|nr:polysaccharide deacetylase family protein [Rhizobiaceae bacterium]